MNFTPKATKKRQNKIWAEVQWKEMVAFLK